MQIYINPLVNHTVADRLLSTDFAATALQYAITRMIVGGLTIDCEKLPAHDEYATDGTDAIKQYEMPGCVVFIVTGYCHEHDAMHIEPAGATIRDLLVNSWYLGGLTLSEHLAAWGYDGTPPEADKSATHVRIWCEPSYYSDAISPIRGHYVRGNDYEPLVFDTFADAQRWVDVNESDTYVLRGGEYGRPAYTICD